MCPKLFILKEFYFLILEKNVGPYHKYSSKWVINLNIKTKESRINELLKKKCFTIIIKKKKHRQFIFYT